MTRKEKQELTKAAELIAQCKFNDYINDNIFLCNVLAWRLNSELNIWQDEICSMIKPIELEDGQEASPWWHDNFEAMNQRLIGIAMMLTMPKEIKRLNDK